MKITLIIAAAIAVILVADHFRVKRRRARRLAAAPASTSYVPSVVDLRAPILPAPASDAMELLDAWRRGEKNPAAYGVADFANLARDIEVVRRGVASPTPIARAARWSFPPSTFQLANPLGVDEDSAAWQLLRYAAEQLTGPFDGEMLQSVLPVFYEAARQVPPGTLADADTFVRWLDTLLREMIRRHVALRTDSPEDPNAA